MYKPLMHYLAPFLEEGVDSLKGQYLLMTLMCCMVTAKAN